MGIEERKATIEALEKEVRESERSRKKARANLAAKKDRTEEKWEAIGELNDGIEHANKVIEVIEKRGGLNGEDWSDERQARRLEAASDRIEESRALKLRLLEDVERIAEQRESAREELQRWIKDVKQDKDKLLRNEKALEIAKRRRKRRRENRGGDLTKNFSVAEFDCNDGTPVPKEAYEALEIWCKTIGEPLRERFGSVHVNSGFRHASYNARIGGEPNSIHIYNYPGRNGRAVAVDLTCASGTPADWFNFTAGRADGRGKYSTFHHADNRNRIGWGDAVWYG